MAQMMKPNLDAAQRQASLEALLRRSIAAYEALSPEERGMHDWAQKISFVRGQLALSSPGYEVHYSREETAIHVLAAGVGMEYAMRMIDNPKFRKIMEFPDE